METATPPGIELGIAPPPWHGRDGLVVVNGASGRILGLNPAAGALIGHVAHEAKATVASLLPYRAARVEIRLTMPVAIVELTVADNGDGLDPAASARGRRSLGMTSMRERATLLGGVCVVENEPGAGTRVTVRLHLSGAEVAGG